MPDYYLNREAEEICLIDYVQDDMKDADALITAPERPSAPSWWNYDTTAEYDAAYAAYEVAYQAYEEAYEAYLNKLGRDELREELEEKTINYSIYTLCFFDGTEEVMLTDTFVGDHYYSNCSTATDAPVITYTAYNQSTLDKVKLSKISSIYDIEEMVRAALFSSSDRYVAIKGNATVIVIHR